jgi:hypothetical protein
LNEAAVRLGASYADFAEKEAAGRSPLYAEICRGIAQDALLLQRLAALPLEKQQPNLLLAAVKYLFGVAWDYQAFRAHVTGQWEQVIAVVMSHRTQTNEPARCATLLPLLALLPQPLALLEVGASAGLCLLPDRYAYDYGGHRVPPAAALGSAPLFRCRANAETPVPNSNIQVAWRAGLDLSPLDAKNPQDAAWLRALVWPGEGERERLLTEALAVAARHPVRVSQGDLRYDLPALAAEAPRDATLVVFHTAVLAYVRDLAERQAFAETVRNCGAQWISNESEAIWDEPDLPPRPWGRFVLALNGRAVAYTDAHGGAIDWFAHPSLTSMV